MGSTQDSNPDPLQDATEALEAAVRTRCGEEMRAVVEALRGEGRFCQPLVVETAEARVRVEVWRRGR